MKRRPSPLGNGGMEMDAHRNALLGLRYATMQRLPDRLQRSREVEGRIFRSGDPVTEHQEEGINDVPAAPVPSRKRRMPPEGVTQLPRKETERDIALPQHRDVSRLASPWLALYNDEPIRKNKKVCREEHGGMSP
jgi:hypothetical protein